MPILQTVTVQRSVMLQLAIFGLYVHPTWEVCWGRCVVLGNAMILAPKEGKTDPEQAKRTNVHLLNFEKPVRCLLLLIISSALHV